MEGLRELPQAHHNPKTILTQKQKEQVLVLKRMFFSLGARRIKERFPLSLSAKAIRRIWRAAGLLKSKRRKYKTKQDLGAVKAQWRLFEHSSMDTEDVIDIPEYRQHVRALGLPKVQ
ncbi:MAG: hypothetical protein ONB14_06680 [candidate division KSB1 bacterium]|nr:hypothetical protein [candidate division KSB1 bacterium]MDZ7379160.1 hypothetical protein [candidate division KSB1 bacterium]MDZ7391622.1 hypothetical protein [candidate division KSB1 bacterium]